MGDLLDYLQRERLLQQAEASASGKLILKKLRPSLFSLDTVLCITGISLSVPTDYLSTVLVIIYVIIKPLLTKTVRVKNIANGEIFKVTKQEFKAYKKQQRRDRNTK
ncbi:MAG: hypothetical protein ACFWT6_15700 [Virgibacillus proomii]|jgi:hypothetical protein